MLCYASWRRACPSGRATPLLLLSSVAHNGAGKHALVASADAVLLKPLRQTHFEDALVEVYWRRAEADVDDQPKRQLDAEAVADTSQGTQSSEQGGFGPAGPSILVVEDNSTNQLVIRAFLDRLGLSASVVENGQLAVDASFAGAFDLELMDCQMPIMDGYAATRAIRAMGGHHLGTPIIAMTANALSGDREKCLEAGMDEHLAKPLSIETLRTPLDRYLPGATQPTRKVHSGEAGAPV